LNRKPRALKVVQGTFRKSRVPANEPKPPPLLRVPKPPQHLSADGRKLWANLAPQLFRLSLLTELDLPAFEIACFAYGLYRELSREIRRRHKSFAAYLKGKNSQTVPELTTLKAAFQTFKGYLAEFGLSPAARGRIDVQVPESEEEDLD